MRLHHRHYRRGAGLIQVMKHLENIERSRQAGIAVAFVATVYGVAVSNLVFLPAANKLKARIRQDAQDKELLLEGVCSIVEGMNPKLIRVKLEAFLQHSGKSKKKADAGASPGLRLRPRARPRAQKCRVPSTLSMRITSAGWSPTPISSRCCSLSSW